LLLEGGLDWKPLSLSPKDMDFIEAKNAAAREIALAIGVPPMLLGIPGDNTYSNYQEAQRAFWRQTVLPLVNRTARALANWLAPGFEIAPSGRLRGAESLGANENYGRPRGTGLLLELRPDLDQIEALAPERDALWKRLEAASFLTTDEKRAAAGYDALGSLPAKAGVDEGESPSAKYNDDQARVPAGQSGGGRWTDGGGGAASTSDGRIRLAQAGERSGYPVDILEEDKLGGHTLERHVGKSEQYLRARVLESRKSIPGVGEYGEKRAGSFTSVEAANKLINSVIAEPQNQQKLKSFGEGNFLFLLPNLYLYPTSSFRSSTGYEAFAPNGRSEPIIGPTNSLEVRVRRTGNNSRGWYIYSAFPLTED